MRHAARVACCQRMQDQLDVPCPDHYDDMSQCPDSLVTRWDSGDYGLRIHNGGTAVVLIDYCPWCGTRPSGPWQAAKRRFWR
jgi:Domain of unknown function (DUF6980)